MIPFSGTFKCQPLIFALAAYAVAQVDVDKTCATCSRRFNDSLNLKVRNIRLNQVGYLPLDPDKAAFVANPGGMAFSVVEAVTRKPVYTGTLKSLGAFTEGAMKIRGAYNSITDLYNLSRPALTENLYRAEFPDLRTPGSYVLACGKDTSASFQIDPKIYNFVFETSLKFFGSNRCGNTHSWMHAACHLKDGDALGPEFTGKLAGGWHDCGDHGKYSETVAYAAMTLSLTYALWPQKGEDFYGASYSDTLPNGTDGIPDVLNEAKVGADYILALYKVSKAKGLIDKGDMYHSVGMGPGMDHSYWDVPENQDAQPQGKGGPARPVTAGIGSNVAGLYAASLAFFAWGWEPFDPVYAKECLAAAADIYAKILVPRRNSSTIMPCCYPGGGPTKDDEGLAALALWFASKDAKYRFDLLDNPALGSDPNAVFNQGTFPTGIMGNSPFHHGGWTTDYENVHAYVLYGLAKLIAGNPQSAAAYGLTAVTADSLRKDCIAALYNSISIGSNGKDKPAPGIHADEPYHGVFTSADWGFNRYNMGLVTELFMYWDLTGDKAYYNIGMDNLNYNLGMNPWDISFVMGTGEKNLQHPHNRAANPEGYNAGGIPYKYRSPLGALMGGCKPSETLIDDWELYTNTETCIDFSSQFLIPAQMLAMDIPEDKEGPKFRNVNIFPEVRTALVTWVTEEISLDTVFLLDAPNGKILQTVPGGLLGKAKQATLTGLTPGTTYYVYFEGMDVRHNPTVDKNGGNFYPFTTKSTEAAAQITGVKVCNETDQSALVTWWTLNGASSSQVDYGKDKTLGSSQSPDDTRLPTLFHRVTLNALDPATLYYFQAISGSTKDDNHGGFYDFRTSEVLVNYTIRVKPTNKSASGASAHFYIEVTNNERKPYTGLELRFYFTADAASAANLVAKGFDNQTFDVGGLAGPLAIEYGAAKQVPGMADQWYFPIVLKSTLPVAGRARFELQINSGSGGWGPYPFSSLKGAWSLRAHAKPPDPAVFPGVDFSKGEDGTYTGPEVVEKVNGEPTISYVEDPFITAYYNGVHVFGYGPDFVADPLRVNHIAKLIMTSPVAGPVDKLDLRQPDGSVILAGQASVSPEGRIDQIILNGISLPESQLTRGTSGSVEFSHKAALSEGTNVFDIIAWDTAHCAIDARKLILNWKNGPVQPPAQLAKPTANPPGRAAKDTLLVQLTSATAGAAIWYTLDGKAPIPGDKGSTLYRDPITVKGKVTIQAVAVKAGWTMSEIMSENYEVFPFHVLNPGTALFRDDNADGYADGLSMAIDTTGGKPDSGLIAAQLARLRLTGGFVPGPCGMSGDSVRCALATNTLPIADNRDSLILTSPAAPADGMLRPGAYPISDKVSPVLRRAILHRGASGWPDTMVAVFSEGVRPGSAGMPQLSARRIHDGSHYDFMLDGTFISDDAIARSLQPELREGEVALLFIVQSASVPGSTASVTGQAGDSLWINPVAGLVDALGNIQVNPDNIRVPLRIATPVRYSVESAAAGGMGSVSKEPHGPPWVVYGGPALGATFGEAPHALPVAAQLPGPIRPGGIVIESSHPFALTLRVHDNLGQFVTKVELQVAAREFDLLEPGKVAGTRRLYLLWNGTADRGNLAATGAYIYAWNLILQPDEGPPQASAGKRIFGLIRIP